MKRSRTVRGERRTLGHEVVRKDLIEEQLKYVSSCAAETVITNFIVV
jgi:hypothetical protein